MNPTRRNSRRWGAQSILIALLAALPAAVAAHGGGGGGGGHGGRTVVVVGGGAQTDLPPFRGDEAAMPLEVADTPPASSEGVMKIGDVIAVHTVRSADAVVLLDPVKGRRRDIPAGTALARMRFAAPFPAARNAIVWCDVRPTGRLLWPQEHDCLQDSQASGKLDKLWQGDSLVHFLGFGLSGVGYYNDPMPAAAGYRSATPQERPAATLGFKYCDGDGVTTPPRFAMAISGDGETGTPLVGACRFGAWLNPLDKTEVDVAGMILSVSPAGEGALRFKVIKPLPAEMIGPLRRDAPLATRAIEAMAGTRATNLARFMLEPAGDPPKVNWGVVQAGQVFATMGARHAFTGTLSNRVRPASGLLGLSGVSIGVGQAMFGVPSSEFAGDGVAWCAPRRGSNAGLVSDCLLPEPGGYLWESDRSPALAPNFGVGVLGGVALASSDPDVQRGPVELPPMTLTLKLGSVTMDNAGVPAPVFHILVLLDWGDGPEPIGQWNYELPPAGRRVEILGAAMQLKRGPGPQDLLVEAAGPAR